MTKLLSVSHDVLMEREKEYRKQVDANPKRRGPKRKSEITAAQQELLLKLQANKRDHTLTDVQEEIVRKRLSRRSRQPQRTKDSLPNLTGKR